MSGRPARRWSATETSSRRAVPGHAACRKDARSRVRRRALFSALALASVVFAAGEASAARIVVTITGLKSNEGGVYVGLYATPSKFLNGAQVDVMKKVRASTAPITVAFDNLPAGT